MNVIKGPSYKLKRDNKLTNTRIKTWSDDPSSGPGQSVSKSSINNL